MAILQEIYFEIAATLREFLFLNGILWNIESRYDLKETDITELEKKWQTSHKTNFEGVKLHSNSITLSGDGNALPKVHNKSKKAFILASYSH